jgi:uncharacterized Zn finger protein
MFKNKNLYWECPNCGAKVDFINQLDELFAETGEACFCTESGVLFHTIKCDICGAKWILSMSGVIMPGEKVKLYKDENIIYDNTKERD